MQLCVLVLSTGTFPLEMIHEDMLKGINMSREHNMTLDHYIVTLPIGFIMQRLVVQ